MSKLRAECGDGGWQAVVGEVLRDDGGVTWAVEEGLAGKELVGAGSKRVDVRGGRRRGGEGRWGRVPNFRGAVAEGGAAWSQFSSRQAEVDKYRIPCVFSKNDVRWLDVEMGKADRVHHLEAG